MVYEILHENDLCRYYDLDANPGISLRGRKQEQFAWLDDPATAEKLLDFSNQSMSRITFYLPQIHCASCIWLIENLYKLRPGIFQSKVNFLKKEVYLTFKREDISVRELAELLASLGYAPSLQLASLDKQEAGKNTANHRLLLQLGVAGFGFGNIMLLSFPEYFGLSFTEEWFRKLFGYFNILLAVPVAFYSGKDYLTAGWHSIRSRNYGIDIPLALGILVLFFRSAFEIVSGTGAGYMDSLAGLVFFLLIGKWFQQITYHNISFERDYRSYFPVAATRLAVDPANGSEQETSVSVNQLAPGDTILVRHKELVPADGIIKKGRALIDYSFVTGEAEPVAVLAGEKIFAGGRQMGEAIELLLMKKVSQSYLTQLWNEAVFKKQESANASKLANQVGKYFTAVILVIAFGTLFYWLPRDPVIAFNAFTAVLIIACPCAAALNIPFTLGNAVRILGRYGFYLKNTQAIESLRKISIVVFDKTGTLTKSTDSQLEYVGRELSHLEKLSIETLARQSSHPLSRQLAAHFQTGELPLPVHDFEEAEGKGISGRVGDSRLRIGSRSFLGLPAVAKAEVPDGSNPVRVDSEPGSVFIELDGKSAGYLIARSGYRPSVWKVLDWFKSKYKVYLLSGDNERERGVLESKFETVDSLLFHQSPQEKLEFVQRQQGLGQKVLMVGDGLNDAGALKSSDVGIVIAEDTNNFTPACDAILDARSFSRLPEFLTYASKSISVVYFAWGVAAIYNVIGLNFAVQGELSPVVAAILMPLSSVSIVGIGVGLSSYYARKILGPVN